MPNLIDPRTLAFQLYDVLGAEKLCERPRFADYSREAFDAVLESAQGIATEYYLPHQKANDTDEPHVVDGKVVLNPGVKPAFLATADAGLLAATHDHAVLCLRRPRLRARRDS